MTGKELIMYILKNDLVDKDLFSGDIAASQLFITPTEAAVKWHTGVSTVKALMELGKVKGLKIGDQYYVLATEKDPFEVANSNISCSSTVGMTR